MSRQPSADGVLKAACYMLIVLAVAFAGVFMLHVHPGSSEPATASHSAVLAHAHAHTQAVQIEEHRADRDAGNDTHRCSHGGDACCPDVHTCCAMASVLSLHNPLQRVGCVAAQLPNVMLSPLVVPKLPPRG